MKLKLALASATALGLMMGVAFADSNKAITNQTGNNNSTDITQMSTTGNGHYGRSDVTGNHNTISIDQDSGTAAHGKAVVTVDGASGNGDYNNVTLSQSHFQGTAQTQNQTATVDIFGDGNTVTGTQKYGTSLESNKLTISIQGNDEGSSNTVAINQFGNGETSKTTIWGDHNDVGVSQGAGTNTAVIYIDGNAGDNEGDYNRINVKQDHGSAPFNGTPGNTARITVYGDGNNMSGGFGGDAATLAGTNGLSAGDIVQSGVMNVARLNVGSGGFDSNSNAFAAKQSGTYNSLTANILGDHNNTVVAQSGDANTTSLLQSGDFNNAAVSQTNASNVATVNQMGNGNATTVTQN